jgi:CheY-like chemotaxis protein
MFETKVLVADDDYAIRNALKRILRSLDCVAVEVADGAAALEAVTQQDISAAILDLSMPVLSGVEVLRAIRSSTDRKNLPVVIITGTADQEMARDVIRLGVSDFLAKPFKPEQLKLRLRRVTRALDHGGAGQFGGGAAAPQSPDSVLVADGSSEFRYFVANALTPRRTVIQAATGTEALRACMATRPAIVLVGTDLGIFGSEMLVQRLRRDPALADTRVALVPAADQPSPVDAALVDGVLARTFIAEAFAQEFEALFEQSFDDKRGPFALVHETVVQATQQALGMMVHTDVHVVTGRDGDAVTGDVCGFVVLQIEDTSSVHVALSCDAPTATRIASRLLGAPEADLTTEDVHSTVGELLNVIVGRVQGAVGATGASAKFTLPSIGLVEGPSSGPAPDVIVHFDSQALDMPLRVSLKAIKTVRVPAAAPSAPAA